MSGTRLGRGGGAAPMRTPAGGGPASAKSAFDVRLPFGEAPHLGAEHGHRALERAPARFRRSLVAVDTPIEPRHPSDHAPGEPETGRQYGADDGEGFSVHGPEPGALSERPPVEPAGGRVDAPAGASADRAAAGETLPRERASRSLGIRSR